MGIIQDLWNAVEEIISGEPVEPSLAEQYPESARNDG